MKPYSVKEVGLPCEFGWLRRRVYVIAYDNTVVSEATPSREIAEDLCKWMNTAYTVGYHDGLGKV